MNHEYKKVAHPIGDFVKEKKKEKRFEPKKPYDFDRNQKRSALSKKEQPNTTGKNRENLNRSNAYGF